MIAIRTKEPEPVIALHRATSDPICVFIEYVSKEELKCGNAGFLLRKPDLLSPVEELFSKPERLFCVSVGSHLVVIFPVFTFVVLKKPQNQQGGRSMLGEQLFPISQSHLFF